MKSRFLVSAILISYTILLIKLMVLKDVPLIRIGALRLNFGGTQEGPPNLIPFKTIVPYLLGNKGLLIASINLMGNIILLIPIGILVPFLVHKISWKSMGILSLAAGMAIEGMQVVLHVGIFDIDDVILNGLGVLLGYGLFPLAQSIGRTILYNKIVLASVLTGMASISILGIYAYRNELLPIGFEPAVLRDHSQQATMRENGTVRDCPTCDLCKGSGGTGQIVGTGDHTITIQRKDGLQQLITLTDQTSIQTSAGAATLADLKIGDRVTIITGSNPDKKMIADVVLVCLSAHPSVEIK